MKVETQFSKLITPSLPTPPTLRHHKLGFIDEFVANVDVGVVLFFSGHNHNSNVVTRLEQSLQKTLTRFYPLAGRYVEEIQTIDCNDQGAHFVFAKTNFKLEDFLVTEANIKLTDDFFPSKTGPDDDWLLASQVTIFECGGLALSVSGSHKLVDVSTLSTIMKEWGSINREENETEIFSGSGFNSHLLFPARGLRSFPVPPPNKDALLKWTRKKLSFSQNLISNMKSIGNNNNRQWSKVQLVTAIIWKAFIYADLATDNQLKDSRLVQAVNLRGKMESLIPKDSCGNLWGFIATDIDLCNTTVVTTEEFVDRVSDCVKGMITNLSKLRHDSEEGQSMVFNSLFELTSQPNLTLISSWCKFPFYETDFGFGKPIWVAPKTVPGDHIAYLMDDAQGGGVEAYVCLQVKDVTYFEEALEHVKAFGA